MELINCFSHFKNKNAKDLQEPERKKVSLIYKLAQQLDLLQFSQTINNTTAITSNII